MARACLIYRVGERELGAVERGEVASKREGSFDEFCPEVSSVFRG
jgi:hypothetical protein